MKLKTLLRRKLQLVVGWVKHFFYGAVVLDAPLKGRLMAVSLLREPIRITRTKRL
ncbi:MAG: hypothetical protein ACK5TR_07640 [Alphaproteobacteria bacterium]|jgi:hypothetical protein|nr:hypothetical protein [Alphaproteobacteria bacterium]